MWGRPGLAPAGLRPQGCQAGGEHVHWMEHEAITSLGPGSASSSSSSSLSSSSSSSHLHGCLYSQAFMIPVTKQGLRDDCCWPRGNHQSPCFTDDGTGLPATLVSRPVWEAPPPDEHLGPGILACWLLTLSQHRVPSRSVSSSVKYSVVAPSW